MVTWVEVVVVRRVKAWIQLLRLKIGDDGEEAAFMVVMLVVAMVMVVMMISPLRIPLYNVKNNCKIVERRLWIIDHFSSKWSIIHHGRTERKGIRKFYKRLLSTIAMTVMMKGQGKKTLERFRGLSSTLAGVRLGGLELWLGAWWWWWWWGWWWRWWWWRW